MKKYILILFLFLSGSSFSQTYLDSIPTVDNFGRVRNGIIVDGIVSVLNTDPSGVKLTELELAYIRSIVGGMYLAGSWQKMKACYGFVGGNAWKHKWNWKDMRDLDAAFRLSFLGGGWIHSGTGAKPNGTSSYADTFFNPNANLSVTSTHLSFYGDNSTAANPNEFEIASSLGDNTDYFSLNTRRLNGIVGYGSSYGNSGFIVASTSNGFYTIGSRNGTILSLFKGGDKLTGTPSAGYGTQLPSITTYLAARHSAGNFVGNYSNKTVKFVTIGSGLTDQQAIQTSNVITYSQGILNRQ